MMATMVLETNARTGYSISDSISSHTLQPARSSSVLYLTRLLFPRDLAVLLDRFTRDKHRRLEMQSVETKSGLIDVGTAMDRRYSEDTIFIRHNNQTIALTPRQVIRLAVALFGGL